MRVVVLLRSVHRDPQSDEIFASLGPCDQAALSTALSLVEHGAEVTALTVGPSADDDCLNIALRCGAVRAVRVWDPAVDVTSVRSLSGLLAATLHLLGFDAVIAGHRSADFGTGAVGPMVAQILDVPHVTSVVSVTAIDGALIVDHLGGDEIISVEVGLPVLITVKAGPRLARATSHDLPSVELWDMVEITLPLYTGNLMAQPVIEARVKGTTAMAPSPSALLLQLKNSGLL